MREIAHAFQVSTYAGVSVASRRLHDHLAEDQALGRVLGTLWRSLSGE